MNASQPARGPNRRRLGWLALAALVIAALAPIALHAIEDPAEDELMAFLRGDEDGSTDAERQAHIDRAIELAPGRARYREVRALFRFDHHDFDGAQRDLDRAIEIEDRPYSRYLRALTFCERSDPERALADLDAAIDVQPDDVQFRIARALARVATNAAAEALLDADRAVSGGPQSGQSHFARGVALSALGRDAEALAAFDDAVGRRADLVHAWRARAECHERLADPAAARADRDEADRRASGAFPASLDPFHY